MIRLAPGLDLPLDAVTQTFAFLARRGAGKTYAAGKLVEEMHDAGAQVVVLDPVGNWYGLRLGADGRGKGIAIPVFGGLHGDIPLEHGAGALVADLVVDRHTSVVLDVSGFRKGQRKEFVTAFAEQLFHRKKGARSPIHLVLEEAHVFAPQRIQHGEERLLGAIEDLVRLGRNYGLGVSLLSQRPQAINKDVLNQTECLVALQTNGAQERKAIEAWISENGAESAAVARTLAPVDLEQIREAMKDTIAKASENDPAKLKKRIVDLERSLAARPTAAPLPRVGPPAALTVADAREIQVCIDKIGAVLARRREPLPSSSMPVAAATPVPTARPTAQRAEANAQGFRRGAREMLAVLAGMGPLTREQLATLAGMSPSSGTFSTYLGELRRAGYVEDTADRQLRATAEGSAFIGSDARTAPRTTEALVAMWSGRFRAGARTMLEHLVGIYPNGVSRDELGERIGMSPASGTFSTYLGELRRNGLVGRGDPVRASASLFIGGA